MSIAAAHLHSSDANDEPVSFIVPSLCAILLMMVTFSLPGREGADVGGLDWVALVKVGCRGAVLLALGLTVLRNWSRPGRELVVWCLFPFGLYVAWSILTATWSPLRTFSLGQAGSLGIQVMLAAVIGILWRNDEDTSRILLLVSLGLMLFSAIVCCVQLFGAEEFGLQRYGTTYLNRGLVHPTSAGAASSLGFLSLLLAGLLWDWPWTRRLLIPGLAVQGLLLCLATSRMALGLAILIGGGAIFFYARRWWLMAMLFAGCCLGTAYLVIDPSLELAAEQLDAMATFIRRGEPLYYLWSLTGRTDLWEVMLKSFWEAPLTGHGYMVASKTGVLDVWFVEANKTAHNLGLQVLVSTGIIGAVLFAWAIARPAWAFLRQPDQAAENRSLRTFVFLMAVWYLIWWQLCSSITGPIQPETVFFFVTLGLAVGKIKTDWLARSAASRENPVGVSDS